MTMTWWQWVLVAIPVVVVGMVLSMLPSIRRYISITHM